MAASEFQKKSLFFIIFAGILTIVLAALPFAESFAKDYLAAHFGIIITNDGRAVSADGEMMGQMTDTTITLVTTLLHLFKIVLWMALVISIVRYVTYLIWGRAFRPAAKSEISSLLRTVLSVIIYIVAFFIVFQSQYPEVQLAPLFTGSAILGIVVGLALQDTLGNLFAGIALQADQPFQVGDVIRLGDRASGVVESVTWRGVKIRTFQNKIIVISNAVLGKEMIEVAPRDNLNARLVFFNTLYADSPAKTAHAVREAVMRCDNVSQKMRPIVRIRNFGDSGLDWEVKYWLDDYSRYNETDSQIRQRIWYVFRREGVGFPFPTRTIHMEQPVPAVSAEEFMDATAERLSKIQIFAPLSDEEMDKLAQGANVRVYAPGEPIVRMGQEGNSMFVIVRGSVRVQIPDNGIPKTVNELKENDFFGEMSLLTGQPRSATVVAAEETEVIQIKKIALKPIFEKNPELVKAICDIIEERQKLLKTAGTEQSQIAKHAGERGVLVSIKKFFGLG